MSVESYDLDDLNEFRKVQKLAYDAALETAQQLRVGMSEKETVQLFENILSRMGAKAYFHAPFAWFGDRTRFVGFKRPLDFNLLNGLPHFGNEFQPSNRRLQKGMAVILDVAPILNGYSADIGYAFAFGEHPAVDKARYDLKEFRTLILEEVLKEKSISEIYESVNRLIRELGYENCHALYPAGVLGHKVGKIPLANLPSPRIQGFQLQTLGYLLAQEIKNLIRLPGNQSPLWNEVTTGRLEEGLWAVEPHIGRDDFGVKWEEILVVTSNNAYWLDDDLPHVRFWNEYQGGRKTAEKTKSPAKKEKLSAAARGLTAQPAL